MDVIGNFKCNTANYMHMYAIFDMLNAVLKSDWRFL
jgi:hypothetical protein